MTIEIKSLNPEEVTLLGDSSLEEWREKHSMPVPGREFMKLVRQGRWDGIWHPGKWLRQRGDRVEMRCSRGLAYRILQDLGEPLPDPLVDDTTIDGFYQTHPQIQQFNDYQRRAFEAVLRLGWGRAAHATNAGKGAVIALLARFAIWQNLPVLVCCDELEVYDALKKEIVKWAEVDPFLIRAGVKTPPAGVTISLAMVPTLAKRLNDELRDEDLEERPWVDWVKKQAMLLLDEADKANSPRWKTVTATAKGSWWRAGFSGSFPTDPFEDMKLTDLMGPVLDRVQNKEMIARGISARPSIELHGYDATPALVPFPTDWYETRGPERRMLVYARTVVHNNERHAFIRDLIRPYTPTAVIVNRIDHGTELTLAIPGAVFLDGSADEARRDEVIGQFQRGEIQVLVVTKILDRGSNRLGHVADLIFASGEGSPRQVLQRIGRGLRRAGGKEYLRLVDVVDQIKVTCDNYCTEKKHSPKCRRWRGAATYLKDAASQRLQVYAAEQFDVKIISSGP